MELVCLMGAMAWSMRLPGAVKRTASLVPAVLGGGAPGGVEGPVDHAHSSFGQRDSWLCFDGLLAHSDVNWQCGIRTGDTPSSEKQKQDRRLPEI